VTPAGPIRATIFEILLATVGHRLLAAIVVWLEAGN
jgi:hypothetical protein